MHICWEIKDVQIYAFYPESFCVKNLAIRKVFAFSDSAGQGGEDEIVLTFLSQHVKPKAD